MRPQGVVEALACHSLRQNSEYISHRMALNFALRRSFRGFRGEMILQRNRAAAAGTMSTRESSSGVD